jgi:DNA-binding MarR family transcriptional regulator
VSTGERPRPARGPRSGRSAAVAAYTRDVDAEPPDHRLSEQLYTVLLASGDAGRAMAERLGMGPNDMAALHHLFLRGPAGPADLSRVLGIGSAAATMLADRLERAGHVQRRAHPEDRRRRTLVPTEHAEQQVWQELGPLLAHLEAAEAGLDEAQRAVVSRYLTAVLAAYRDYTARDDAAVEPTEPALNPG